MIEGRRNGAPIVLVTDAAKGSAVAIIRSLGKKGWHVIAADCLPGSAGFYSRYAQEHFLYPSPATHPKEFVATILDAARERRVDLIIPTYDPVTLPLSESRARFDGVCEIALADKRSFDVVTDKSQTLELAKRLGVPVPRTCAVRTLQEALEAVRTFSWPVVVKPQASFEYRPDGGGEYRAVSYAIDSSDLARQMKQFLPQTPVLLQEWCAGVGYGVELLAHRGRPLAAFQHKRLREFPVTGGISTFREGVKLDPDLYDHATRMLRELNWTGLAMVEFKVGKGGPKLMEINGRVWGSLPLAVHSGVDFPGRLADLYLHGPPEPDVPPFVNYKAGVRVRNLELDLAWIRQVFRGEQTNFPARMPARREALSALVSILNPRYRFDILSLSDPRPGGVEVYQILTRLGKEMLRPNRTKTSPGVSGDRSCREESGF